MGEQRLQKSPGKPNFFLASFSKRVVFGEPVGPGWREASQALAGLGHGRAALELPAVGASGCGAGRVSVVQTCWLRGY